ncbi:MarC family protein [uncultured Sunxiuqinia sp.]|uniref:MarC family protein n=1 Tax=uncultured Sunxiuqinia sp. TaxID=1573825 RepID=UPI002AA8D52E|nr:MarC family protein [uncultured Sunxiuqinia sp.]
MSDNLVAFSFSVFTGFFAIMNPIANTPIFLGLVEAENEQSRKKTAKTASITAFLIVVSFVILGKYIFDLFGITIPAFKLTGGLLLFYVGFDMLQSKKSRIHHQDQIPQGNDVAVSPLAIPILAGPGTIVTAMNHVTDGNYINMAIVIAIFALMIFLTYLAFSFSNLIVKKLGHNLITVVGKIMGLILAIMGTGMAIEGIKLAF